MTSGCNNAKRAGIIRLNSEAGENENKLEGCPESWDLGAKHNTRVMNVDRHGNYSFHYKKPTKKMSFILGNIL